MRQVFSSPRLENVERVAQLLEDAGIQTRVTHGRSYRGGLRGNFSYREGAESKPVPAVWVVRSSLSDELADGLAKALLRAAASNQKIHLNVDRLTVPLHAGAKTALAALGTAEEVQAPAPEPQPNATN